MSHFPDHDLQSLACPPFSSHVALRFAQYSTLPQHGQLTSLFPSAILALTNGDAPSATPTKKSPAKKKAAELDGDGGEDDETTPKKRKVATPRKKKAVKKSDSDDCLLYTSPSPRDGLLSRMPSSA